MELIDKAIVIGQANIEITNCRLAAQQGILTDFGRCKLEGLEGIVDFINNFKTKNSVTIDAIAMPSDGTLRVNKEDLNQFEDGDKVILQIIKQ